MEMGSEFLLSLKQTLAGGTASPWPINLPPCSAYLTARASLSPGIGGTGFSDPGVAVSEINQHIQSDGAPFHGVTYSPRYRGPRRSLSSGCPLTLYSPLEGCEIHKATFFNGSLMVQTGVG